MLRGAPCVQNPGGLRVYFAVAPHGLIHPGDSRHYLGLARRNIRPLRVALDLILITGTAECLVVLTVSDKCRRTVSASATGAVVRRSTRAPRPDGGRRRTHLREQVSPAPRTGRGS